MAAGDLLLRGGNVLGPDGMLRPADVLVRQGAIAAVGPRLDAPDDGQVVNLADRAVLPGLIDAHTHLTHGYAGAVGDREAAQGVRAAFQALRALRAGITTVRELGSYRQVDIALRDAINAGRVLGPRMLCAGTYLTITGGHGHPKGRAADGVAEVRRAVREQVLAGADLIKVMCSGGAARRDESPDASQFTAEEISAIIDEAALAGRRVAAHAHPARSIRWALQAGANSIEHGTFLDDECCDLLAEKGAFLVPTMHVYQAIAGSERWPDLRERAAFLHAHKTKTFRRAADRGAAWAVGTDCSMFLPIEDYWRELAAICQVLEIEPRTAILAASAGNASLLGLDGLGEISPGSPADMIVIAEGDPTRDLSALANIRYTIASGRIIDWAAMDAAFGTGWSGRHGSGDP